MDLVLILREARANARASLFYLLIYFQNSVGQYDRYHFVSFPSVCFFGYFKIKNIKQKIH